jgi:ABC-type tungstate transport system substrate-binding protein
MVVKLIVFDGYGSVLEMVGDILKWHNSSAHILVKVIEEYLSCTVVNLGGLLYTTLFKRGKIGDFQC